MKTWVVNCLLLLLIISKIRGESYGSNVEPWNGGEDHIEEIGEEWWVEEEDGEEIGIKMWGEERPGKVPVNVDSFGAVGDGIADDTQVCRVIINFIRSSLHFNNNTFDCIYNQHEVFILILRQSNSDVYSIIMYGLFKSFLFIFFY
jgi:hypothetical protein